MLLVLFGIAIGFAAGFVSNKPDPKDVTEPTSYQNYDDCARNGGELLFVDTIQINLCTAASVQTNDTAYAQYSAQNLPRLVERKAQKVANNVIGDAPISDDLRAFLTYYDQGNCEATAEVIKEIPNRFALVRGSGCDDSVLYPSIAIKLGDGWSYISTTNNLDEDGMPSCLVVDMFKLSKDLVPKCFENTGYNDGTLKDVVYE
jgi:hypothetical protein